MLTADTGSLLSAIALENSVLLFQTLLIVSLKSQAWLLHIPNILPDFFSKSSETLQKYNTLKSQHWQNTFSENSAFLI